MGLASIVEPAQRLDAHIAQLLSHNLDTLIPQGLAIPSLHGPIAGANQQVGIILRKTEACRFAHILDSNPLQLRHTLKVPHPDNPVTTQRHQYLSRDRNLIDLGLTRADLVPQVIVNARIFYALLEVDPVD